MQTSRILIVLTWIVVLLALLAAGAGIFLPGGAGPRDFTSLWGETVQIYGQGIYQRDSLLIGAGFRGTDVVTLILALPLLVVALLAYQRGSIRGRVLLVGLLGYFVYNSMSLAFGATFNRLLLVYIAEFSVSLWALLLALTSLDIRELATHVADRLPRRAIGILLIVSGVVTALIWLSDIIPALLEDRAALTLAHYTTATTYVMDLSFVLPATAIAGLLLMRRAPAGYIMAVAMLTLLMLVGPVVIGQTVAQVISGLEIPPQELVSKVISFVILAGLAAWGVLRLLGALEEPVQA